MFPASLLAENIAFRMAYKMHAPIHSGDSPVAKGHREVENSNAIRKIRKLFTISVNYWITFRRKDTKWIRSVP